LVSPKTAIFRINDKKPPIHEFAFNKSFRDVACYYVTQLVIDKTRLGTVLFPEGDGIAAYFMPFIGDAFKWKITLFLQVS